MLSHIKQLFPMDIFEFTLKKDQTIVASTKHFSSWGVFSLKGRIVSLSDQLRALEDFSYAENF